VARILVPVDYSERSCRAVRYALPFAARFHAETILLHVLAPHHEIGTPDPGSMVLDDLIAERREQANRRIDGYLQNELASFKIRRVLLEGDPAGEIVDFAHGEHCDWIFMPTHGYGTFRRLLLGSVTAKVLHDAECAVWTGAHIEHVANHEPSPLRRVLCGVNLSASSPRVLGWAAQLAAEFEACLTVVHVVDSLIPGTEGFQLSPEWRKQVSDSAAADLAGLQHRIGTSATVSLRMGDPAEGVCAETRRLGADLLVIGRSSETGILGRLTERAYAIIRQSPCPVVSV
jgi:nucleotide-binding universal stress UspA family protein